MVHCNSTNIFRYKGLTINLEMDPFRFLNECSVCFGEKCFPIENIFLEKHFLEKQFLFRRLVVIVVIKVTIMVVAVVVMAAMVVGVVVDMVVSSVMIIMVVEVDIYGGVMFVALLLTFEKRFTSLKLVKHFSPK